MDFTERVIGVLSSCSLFHSEFRAASFTSVWFLTLQMKYIDAQCSQLSKYRCCSCRLWTVEAHFFLLFSSPSLDSPLIPSQKAPFSRWVSIPHFRQCAQRGRSSMAQRYVWKIYTSLFNLIQPGDTLINKCLAVFSGSLLLSALISRR